MANQPKSAKQLENELQALIDGAKKIEKDLAEARKVEAEKVARQKAAAEKRARKAQNTRKAEFENIKIDYEDVLEPQVAVVKKVSVKPAPAAPKPVATVINTNPPAPKQEEKSEPTFWDGLFGRKGK